MIIVYFQTQHVCRMCELSGFVEHEYWIEMGINTFRVWFTTHKSCLSCVHSLLFCFSICPLYISLSSCLSDLPYFICWILTNSIATKSTDTHITHRHRLSKSHFQLLTSYCHAQVEFDNRYWLCVCMFMCVYMNSLEAGNISIATASVLTLQVAPFLNPTWLVLKLQVLIKFSAFSWGYRIPPRCSSMAIANRFWR